MKPRRMAVGITLESGLREKIQVIADREGRSLSRQIEQFLKASLAAYESDHGEIPVDQA